MPPDEDDQSDLPQDLTFNDPIVSGRPLNLHLSRQPKPEPVSTPLQKLRDLVIGLLLLAGFFAVLYAMTFMYYAR